MISCFKVSNFNCATGIILLAHKKAKPLIKKVKINKGLINLNKGMPADLMATISKVSPRLPKVIIEEINNAKGSAKGTQVIATTPIR